MNETVDDLTITFEEDGVQVVKETGKVVLSKGSWTTIVFRFQEWRAKTSDYGPEKFAIRRYQKSNGQYVYKSKFVISSADQARKLIDALEGWIGSSEKAE